MTKWYPYSIARKRFIIIIAALLSLCAGECVTEEDPGGAPDLLVGYVSRTPRYPAYAADYSDSVLLVAPRSGEPLAHDRIKKVKRWPERGEKVTFTGIVLNCSATKCGEFEYAWYVDGEEAERGTHEGLAGPPTALAAVDELDVGGKPVRSCKRKDGTVARIEFEWKWLEGEHTIELVLDPDGKIGESCEKNNRLKVRTDALAFAVAVDLSGYNSWLEHENAYGSRSLEDWLKQHVDALHEVFARSVHPLTPKGVLERIRIDALFVVPDDYHVEALEKAAHESGWDGFCNLSGVAADEEYAKDTDWQLIAEWCGQLDLISYDNLDTAGVNIGNHVTDSSGMPVLLGYSAPWDLLMEDPEGRELPEHAACALNLKKGRRRGFKGDYLYAVPRACVIRVLDAAGKEIPDAAVSVYQQRDGVILDDADQKGVTGRKGEMELANQPIRPVLTDGGFALKSNVLGNIDRNGRNGVLFFVIEARGSTAYHWLSVADLNLAFWRGNEEKAEFQIKTMIPAVASPQGPKNPRVEHDPESNAYQLVWDGPDDSRARRSTYSVFRLDEFPPVWKPVAEKLQKTAYTVTEPGRYAVMCRDREGLLSGVEKVLRVYPMESPWGIALAGDGSAFIRDTGSDRLLKVLVDGRMAGPVGPRLGAVKGGRGIAVGSGGEAIITFSSLGGAGRGLMMIDPAGNVRIPQASEDADFGRLSEPGGASVDNVGRIYVADSGNNRVVVFSPKGEYLHSVGEKGSGLDQFLSPSMAVLDKAGYLYVADTGNNRVHVMEPAEDMYITASEITGLKEPAYVAVDSKGYLYISNTGNDTVDVYKDSGGHEFEKVTSFNGEEDSKLSRPTGIAVDEKSGVALVVDSGHHRIVRVALDELRGDALDVEEGR